MPAIFRLDGYRFYFYSHEPDEPPHVHIDKGGASIKVWLDPVAMAGNTGFLADASPADPAVCEVDGGDMASIGPR
ncbi:hypothetical protein C100_02375 [Sphingobium sp. C100]|uniref:DUF4160 domain-containing protein n=1 Tax=Sphingobium sp. C100 TaxID=1207055 RepID=UPI0003D5E1F2|nr:DUF4160 domain-containing protein [Sphingobium sp. C100]ETI65373.1 hypothetical protein C100_02375 [Sphingobium sp. C100]